MTTKGKKKMMINTSNSIPRLNKHPTHTEEKGQTYTPEQEKRKKKKYLSYNFKQKMSIQTKARNMKCLH
jgi:hypothetical protein